MEKFEITCYNQKHMNTKLFLITFFLGLSGFKFAFGADHVFEKQSDILFKIEQEFAKDSDVRAVLLLNNVSFTTNQKIQVIPAFGPKTSAKGGSGSHGVVSSFIYDGGEGTYFIRASYDLIEFDSADLLKLYDVEVKYYSGR